MSTYRVAARFTIGSEEAINVWHQSGDDGGRESFSDALGHFYNATHSDSPRGIKSIINGLVTLTDITFTKNGSDDPPLVVTAGLDSAGTGGCLPLGCSICLSLRTDTAGRSGRGRIYLPPFSASIVQNATFGPQIGTTEQGILKDAITDLMDGAPGLGVYSPKEDVMRNVIAIFFRPTFSYQRRRQNGMNAPYVTVPHP